MNKIKGNSCNTTITAIVPIKVGYDTKGSSYSVSLCRQNGKQMKTEVTTVEHQAGGDKKKHNHSDYSESEQTWVCVYFCNTVYNTVIQYTVTQYKHIQTNLIMRNP